jgi:hypothetical protein
LQGIEAQMTEFTDNSNAGTPSAKPSENMPHAKLHYAAPTLSIYGSVRQLTGSQSNVGLDVMGMVQLISDAAYKENAVRIGEHPAGFGLYLFDYKPAFRDAFGHGRQFGVMAQEVEPIVPEAVTMGDDGYRRVDYARLGITRH